jgi:catechol 2,3-dioxygenase-like lactoylglutathione lyase family enzyme
VTRIWTIIGVDDVPSSFHWYQTLLGQSPGSPAHDYFGQILDIDGTVLLCLHQWGAHEHPSLTRPDHATPGNGLLLFFRIDDFDAALQRARSLASHFEGEPHLNPNTGTMEFSLRDPDGYYVTISAFSASQKVRGISAARSSPAPCAADSMEGSVRYVWSSSGGLTRMNSLSHF